MKDTENKSFKFLVESEIEKAELVLAVKAMTDELQTMAEKISKMQVEDISAITERIKAEFGVPNGDAFQADVSAILQNALSSLQTTKAAIDNKALVLSGDQVEAEMIPDVDTTDLSSETEETPEEDIFAGHEGAAGPDEEPLGRAKKESVKISGKKLFENDLAAVTTTVEAPENVGMRSFTYDVLRLAKEAGMVNAGESLLAPAELAVLAQEIDDKKADVTRSMSALAPGENEKFKMYSSMFRLLNIAQNFVEKARHKDIKNEIEGMINHLEARGMTESTLYKKLNLLKEGAKDKSFTVYASYDDPSGKGRATTQGVIKNVRDVQHAKDVAAQKWGKTRKNIKILKATAFPKSINESGVTRKHFQEVADLLKEIPDMKKRKQLAKHHADIFKKQNPNFSYERFYNACGVKMNESIGLKKK